MSSSYNRNTELRNVHTRDLYTLSVILDDENYWQILMEIIPKEINNQTFGTPENLEKLSSEVAYERKYSNDHIRLIESAIRRPGESRLYTQILFDEWGSSGRKHERPTLGVLLHLLVLSKLYRGADFVAELLNEPKPPRPNNGPAAAFEFELDIFNDIQETVNDTRFYPNTEELQAKLTMDINKDYYTKYHIDVDKKIWAITDNNGQPMKIAPKPPPRLLKSARILKQQQKEQKVLQQQYSQSLQQTAKLINQHTQNYNEPHLNTQYNESISSVSASFSRDMPNLSALMNAESNSIGSTTLPTTTNYTVASRHDLPKLSALNNISVSIPLPYEEDDKGDSLNSMPSLIFTKSNIAPEEYEYPQCQHLKNMPILVLKSLNTTSEVELKADNNAEMNNDLPAISALNINGERDDVVSQQVQERNLENCRGAVSLNFSGHGIDSFNERIINDDDLNIPCLVANMSFNENLPTRQLEVLEQDYNESEHDHDSDVEDELDDGEDSIPNLSFLENRSYNNESSLTSVTNTSGDNSFEQSVNDCSSTSTDNVPCFSVFNQ